VVVRLTAELYFPSEQPWQLQSSFTTEEWLFYVVEPLNVICRFIIPPLKLIWTVLLLGILVWVLCADALPNFVLILYVFLGLNATGLLNGILTTHVVADLSFQRLTRHLEDFFGRERGLSFRFVTRRDRGMTKVRYLAITKMGTPDGTHEEEQSIVDEENMVGVVQPNDSYCIAMPLT